MLSGHAGGCHEDFKSRVKNVAEQMEAWLGDDFVDDAGGFYSGEALVETGTSPADRFFMLAQKKTAEPRGVQRPSPHNAYVCIGYSGVA